MGENRWQLWHTENCRKLSHVVCPHVSQTERLGVRDYRVEPVRGADLAKLLVPAAGLAAFAVLAGQCEALNP